MKEKLIQNRFKFDLLSVEGSFWIIIESEGTCYIRMNDEGLKGWIEIVRSFDI